MPISLAKGHQQLTRRGIQRSGSQHVPCLRDGVEISHRRVWPDATNATRRFAPQPSMRHLTRRVVSNLCHAAMQLEEKAVVDTSLKGYTSHSATKLTKSEIE